MAEIDEAEMKRVFAQANKADPERETGIKLFGGGRYRRGLCPVNKCGKKDDRPFWFDTSTRRFGCFSCPAKGDVVEMVRLVTHCADESPLRTAERLAGGKASGVALPARTSPRPLERGAGSNSAPANDSPTQGEDAWKGQVAAQLWREALPAAGSLVETYLRARGWHGPVLEAALRQVRFNPRALYGVPVAGGAPVWGRATILPAMIGLVRTHAGPTGGVHATYLSPDGTAKTHRKPAKRMWGPQGYTVRCPAGPEGLLEDRAVPGGVWLTHPGASGPLVVGEGIESTGSAAILLDQPCRAVATLALSRLQGGWLGDKWGRRDPGVVRADLEKPAFTWPEDAAAPWGEVLICVDRDMKPQAIKRRKAAGGTYEYKLTADERAAICGALARQQWQAQFQRDAIAAAEPPLHERGANLIRILAPAPGRDFNNELVERAARASLPSSSEAARPSDRAQR